MIERVPHVKPRKKQRGGTLKKYDPPWSLEIPLGNLTHTTAVHPCQPFFFWLTCMAKLASVRFPHSLTRTSLVEGSGLADLARVALVFFSILIHLTVILLVLLLRLSIIKTD